MKNLHISTIKENESVKEYAYRVIKENILNLTLTPGTKISEKELSDTLSISRTPVREAFIRLAQQDLLEIYPQRGTYISKINTEQIAEFRFLRVTLEQAIMHLACESFPKEELHRLQKCIDAQSDCLVNNDCEHFFELDNQMHCIIFTGCQKPNIWKIIQEANLNYVRSRILDLYSQQSEIKLLFQQHQQILKAITEHDQRLGHDTITQHVNKVIGDVNALKTRYPNYYD